MTAPRPEPRTGEVFRGAAAACDRRRKRAKSPPPFSLRLNAEERKRLEQAAGGAPLGAYIKEQLFQDGAPKRKGRGKAPVKDHAAVGRILGMFGELRLATSLDQLSEAARRGTLPVSPELEAELMRTCAAVLAIRAELMRALGYAPEDGA